MTKRERKYHRNSRAHKILKRIAVGLFCDMVAKSLMPAGGPLTRLSEYTGGTIKDEDGEFRYKITV